MVIAEHTKHSGFGKGNWILEHAIGDERRVPVLEELEILAHDKRVKEALVDHVESADRTILPGIADEELQDGRAAGCGRLRNTLMSR